MGNRAGAVNPLNITDLISPRKRLLLQDKEIRQLKKDIAQLQQHNESMRQGMRRCVSCEYRIQFKREPDNESEATDIIKT
ncbi:MAG: hypothetical protein V7754_03765 [Halioglobus sp.]